MKIGASNVINVKLEVEVMALQEVVVTGYALQGMLPCFSQIKERQASRWWYGIFCSPLC